MPFTLWPFIFWQIKRPMQPSESEEFKLDEATATSLDLSPKPHAAHV